MRNEDPARWDKMFNGLNQPVDQQTWELQSETCSEYAKLGQVLGCASIPGRGLMEWSQGIHVTNSVPYKG